jgi:hypothetical protein
MWSAQLGRALSQGIFAMRKSLTREVNIATTVPRSASRLPNQAMRTTTVPTWMLTAAAIAAGLAYLTVASHNHGAAARIEQSRRPPIAKGIVPADVEHVHLPARTDSPQPLPPALSGVSFRFGFLEFEDDPDASAK